MFLVRDVTFIMQMGTVENESVESLLLALTKFPAADIAKCPLDLIEKASHLIERARYQSVPAPSPASPPRPQDEEGLIPVTVPSSPPRPQDEEDLTPVTVPSSPPRPRDEEGLVSTTVSEHVPLSNGHTSDPVGANTAAVETNANEVFQALLEAIEETKGLLRQDVKDVIRGDLSPAAYDPCVQDLEACTKNRPSNAQKLRHIIVLPKWLKAYEDFCSHYPGRGELKRFSIEKGLDHGTAREGMFRAKRLRDIISCYGKPGLEAPLGLIVSQLRRLTKEVRPVVARLCQRDSSVAEAIPALSKFYEECDAEYTILFNERLAAFRHVLLPWGTHQTHPKQASGFVEDTEVEEPPINEGQHGFISGYQNTRLSTEGVDCTTVAQYENPYGIKRSFGMFQEHSDDVSLHATRPSSVCTGSATGMDA
jgi:hypothetical protein